MSGKAQAAAVLVFLCWAIGAGAVEGAGNNNRAGERAFAPAYGQAQPPVGFVDFCTRQPAECRPLGGARAKARLTPERWQQLDEVNRAINRQIAPASDRELYGLVEHWTLPADAGDCEDYVLLKKRYLEGLGFAAETLLIAVVLDEQGDGHAVLMARTDAGDLVLDNRRDEIRPWSETRYRFLKRQSQENPMAWVKLTPKSTREAGAIAAGN